MADTVIRWAVRNLVIDQFYAPGRDGGSFRFTTNPEGASTFAAEEFAVAWVGRNLPGCDNVRIEEVSVPAASLVDTAREMGL